MKLLLGDSRQAYESLVSATAGWAALNKQRVNDVSAHAAYDYHHGLYLMVGLSLAVLLMSIYSSIRMSESILIPVATFFCEHHLPSHRSLEIAISRVPVSKPAKVTTVLLFSCGAWRELLRFYRRRESPPLSLELRSTI